MKGHAWKMLVVAFFVSGTTADAQFMNFGPGSTIQGDFLRGAGVAAFGEGYYNEATARAFAINTQTVANWNDYVERVTEYQTAKWFRHMRAVYAKRQDLWRGIQERLRNNPDEFSVLNGDALNNEMERMRAPNIAQSSFRYAPIALDIDMVRSIPFKLAEANANFSAQGLSIKGKKTWETALRGEEFAPERAAYDKALKAARDEQLEMRLSVPRIRALEKALADLQRKLDEVVGQGSPEYLDAKKQLNALQKGVSNLYNTKIERVFAELHTYSGSTVEDLMVFMRKFNLRFAAADSPEERDLYPKLYEIFRDQRQKVAQSDVPPAN